MKPLNSTAKDCSLMLREWEKNLKLTCLEKSQLAGELKTLNRQINRLINRHIRLTVFGKVGVGKSSLLNALLGKKYFTNPETFSKASYKFGTINNPHPPYPLIARKKGWEGKPLLGHDL